MAFIFLPYIVYVCLTFVYLIDILNNDQEEDNDKERVIIGSTIVCLVAYLITTEVQQMRNVGLVKYFTNIVNYMDLYQFIMNLFLVLTSLLEIEFVHLNDTRKRALSSLIMICLWMKMFDWLRMFDHTSKFVSLIMQTIYDILPFMLLFTFILFMFGSAMFLLNSEQDGGLEVID